MENIPALRHKLAKYKARCKTKKITFNLTLSQFDQIVRQSCYYCGAAPAVRNKEKRYQDYKCNGLDRVDNDKGYIAGNVVACCPTCNQLKSNMSVSEFYTMVNSIYKHSIKGSDKDV